MAVVPVWLHGPRRTPHRAGNGGAQSQRRRYMPGGWGAGAAGAGRHPADKTDIHGRRHGWRRRHGWWWRHGWWRRRHGASAAAVHGHGASAAAIHGHGASVAAIHGHGASAAAIHGHGASVAAIHGASAVTPTWALVIHSAA